VTADSVQATVTAAVGVWFLAVSTEDRFKRSAKARHMARIRFISKPYRDNLRGYS
jgi:hypothetical protein